MDSVETTSAERHANKSSQLLNIPVSSESLHQPKLPISSESLNLSSVLISERPSRSSGKHRLPTEINTNESSNRSGLSVSNESLNWLSVSERPSNSPVKYYRQLYRREWEAMPDFQGWLKSVPGLPTRAYCKYCDKSLHAHRLSLLKHTCTLKHTKAAQKVFAQKAAAVSALKPGSDGSSTSDAELNASVSCVDDSFRKSPNETMQKDSDVDEPEAIEQSESEDLPPAVQKVEMDNSESALSTHVLDTAKGNPIGGLQVSLYRLIDGRWTHISEGNTNPDGRYSNFIKKDEFVAGRYKLHFDVDRYFELRRVESFYPFIEIVFDVKSPQDHYHVPLLLSPFGYTTYRGS